MIARSPLVLQAPMMGTVIRHNVTGENTMWTKPEATEMRFGFEVTMYVCNR